MIVRTRNNFIKNFKILFIDDDLQILSIVEQFISRWGFEIKIVSSGKEAMEAIQSDFYDIVFSDLIMPDISGLDVLQQVKKLSPDSEVVIVSGYGTIESAIQAMKLGSYDFLQKPINFDRFKLLIERIIEKQNLKEENQRIRRQLKERFKYDELVGMSPKMQEIYAIIDRIGVSSPTVLIEGESGTGKGLTANVIHNNSDRRDGPFITVNCGAIAESLLERELFGHVKGAFTGAEKDSEGLFKAADGGTLFLDEIAEISPTLQVSLLRVLQEKKFRPVGDTREIDANVRVIAATNKKLIEAIKNRSFREDLYYRLNVISITMPPLRDLREDIPLLANHFLVKHTSPKRKNAPEISPEAMAKLQAYHWPGNGRQLENVIQRTLALSDKTVFQPHDFPKEIANRSNRAIVQNADLNLREIERKAILQALKKTDGNKAEAARLLGVNTTTVYRKMAKYNIMNSDSC